MHGQNDKFNKDMKTMKKNQTDIMELKRIVTET